MIIGATFSGRRLLLSVLLAASLALFFELALSGGLPSLDEIPTLIIGFVFFALFYSFFISVLYTIALGAAQLKISAWITFPLLWIAISGAFQYFGSSDYDSYELGGRMLVIGHKFTAQGWDFFAKEIATTVIIAVITTAALFSRRHSGEVANT